MRRAYRYALDAGARTRGRTWRKIDARRGDVHRALLADSNAALRTIFADPIATDLYFGTDNICRSVIGYRDHRPFLKLALESVRAQRAAYQLERLRALLDLENGKSVVEIGPGVGHCAYLAHRAGLTDYTTIDLPLGVVAQARFLAEALSPRQIWMDGEPDVSATSDQIKLFSVAHLPSRHFAAAVNVDSLTEMSLSAALDYIAWINQHAGLFLSINHELNPFTVAEIARHDLAGKRIARTPLPERPGYFDETFLVDQLPAPRKSVSWLRAKTLFWSVAVPIRWRVPFLRPTTIPG